MSEILKKSGRDTVTGDVVDIDIAVETLPDGRKAEAVVVKGQPAEKHYFAFIFGDETTTEATAASTAETSAAFDTSLLDPAKSSIEGVITGSTAGDISVQHSRNGSDDWVEAYTVAYTAVGGFSIDLSNAGYGRFTRLVVTDSSVTAGTIKSWLTGRGA